MAGVTRAGAAGDKYTLLQDVHSSSFLEKFQDPDLDLDELIKGLYENQFHRDLTYHLVLEPTSLPHEVLP